MILSSILGIDVACCASALSTALSRAGLAAAALAFLAERDGPKFNAATFAAALRLALRPPAMTPPAAATVFGFFLPLAFAAFFLRVLPHLLQARLR